MPRGQEVAKKATFGVDDKRAQYARLVVFNHGVKSKLIGKDKDVNSATNAEIEKAAKDLVGGNMLDGPGGIEQIQSLSKKGSTTGNPLTVAYAQEVRPFIRRLQFSDSFGRRSKPRAEKPAAAKKESKKSASKKGGRASRSSAKPTPAPSEAEGAQVDAPSDAEGQEGEPAAA